MLRFNKIKQLTNRFRNNVSGSLVPTAALAITAVMLSAGIAIDYSRIAHAKTVMANSMDSALLATARDLQAGQTNEVVLKQKLEDFFLANVVGQSVSVADFEIKNFEIDVSTGSVRATLSSKLKTTFMSIAGFDEVNVPVMGEATYASNPVEVAFMLDVTGSMGSNGRMTALKAATTNAVNLLLDGTTGGRVKVGLAPYASSVNVGNLQVLANGQAPANGCVFGRDQKEYSSEKFSNYPLIQASACPAAKIQGLTDKKQKLLDTISQLSPAGSTAGHLGISWSQYILNSNVGVWQGENVPRLLNTGVQKIAILMTDGKFNTYRGAYQNNVTPAKSKFSSRKMCEEMRDSGIKIYSIVFGSNENDPLQSCASELKDGTKLFYKVNTASQLIGVFEDIANDINRLRLSS